MKLIRTNIFFGLLLFIFISHSCIQRLRRPEIKGRILDYNGVPIGNCIVGENKTDKNGNFHLEVKTHNAFFLTEIFAMEAPPMMVSFEIKKMATMRIVLRLFINMEEDYQRVQNGIWAIFI